MLRLFVNLTALSSHRMFITQISRLLSLLVLMKAVWEPSGEYAGASSRTALSVRRLGSLVVAFSGCAFIV
jgi:hypothetical protein